MMGIALVQVVRSDRDRVARQVALGLFALQLVLNFGWSWIFFTNHDLGRGARRDPRAVAGDRGDDRRVRARSGRSAAALLLPYLGVDVRSRRS